MQGFILVVGAIASASASAAMAADEQPICADRPGKANPTCTVPAGMVQIETGLADWVHDRSGAVTTDALALGATAFKYGLNSRWNIELDVAPYNSVRVRGGMRQFDSSFGDLVLKSKYRFTHGDGVQVAMNPALKIPTAAAPVGNRKWEAGIAFPIDYSIPRSQFGITLGPEIDWLADANGDGHHLAMAQVVGIGWQTTPKLNVSAELWGQWNWDSAGIVRQSTADASIAYLVSNDVQLDAGANFGLNHQAPDVELYTGVSVRF
ncbi:MAG: transporter [Pseudomonadota bacterium]|jgi:hypothetical protein